MLLEGYLRGHHHNAPVSAHEFEIKYGLAQCSILAFTCHGKRKHAEQLFRLTNLVCPGPSCDQLVLASAPMVNRLTLPELVWRLKLVKAPKVRPLNLLH